MLQTERDSSLKPMTCSVSSSVSVRCPFAMKQIMWIVLVSMVYVIVLHHRRLLPKIYYQNCGISRFIISPASSLATWNSFFTCGLTEKICSELWYYVKGNENLYHLNNLLFQRYLKLIFRYFDWDSYPVSPG